MGAPFPEPRKPFPTSLFVCPLLCTVIQAFKGSGPKGRLQSNGQDLFFLYIFFSVRKFLGSRSTLSFGIPRATRSLQCFVPAPRIPC